MKDALDIRDEEWDRVIALLAQKGRVPASAFVAEGVARRLAETGAPPLAATVTESSRRSPDECAVRLLAAVGSPGRPLTRMECLILLVTARGLTSKQAGQALCISERTAEWHMNRVRRKLGAHTTLEALAVVGTWTIKPEYQPLFEVSP